MFSTENPALVIIDVQQAIDHFGMEDRSQPDAESNMNSLLTRWRHLSLPVIHIRHSSRYSNSPYHASSEFYDFKTEVAPLAGEAIITKRENCAFLDTELEELLKQANIQELVITGVLLNHSVDATVRIASGLGFRVILPSDTTAASPLELENGERVKADQIHQIMLSNLKNEYAYITDSHSILTALSQYEEQSS